MVISKDDRLAEAARLKEKERLQIEAKKAETVELQQQQEEEPLRIEAEAATEAIRLKQEEEACLRIEAEAAETVELQQQQEEEPLRIEIRLKQQFFQWSRTSLLSRPYRRHYHTFLAILFISIALTKEIEKNMPQIARITLGVEV